MALLQSLFLSSLFVALSLATTCQPYYPPTNNTITLGGIGATCVFSDQCQAALYCVHSVCTKATFQSACTTYADCPDIFECIGGKCVPTAWVGDSCSASTDCITQKCVSGKCAALAVNDSCSSNLYDFCGTGLVCVYSSTQGEVCSAPKNQGQICSGDYDCVSGLYCLFNSSNSYTTVCSPKHPAGGYCLYDSDCATGLICSDQVCSTPLALGASCSGIGTECSTTTFCSSQLKCIAYKSQADGVPCYTSEECQHRCNVSVCGPYVNAGGACYSADDCVTGLWCQGSNYYLQTPGVCSTNATCDTTNGATGVCGYARSAYCKCTSYSSGVCSPQSEETSSGTNYACLDTSTTNLVSCLSSKCPNYGGIVNNELLYNAYDPNSCIYKECLSDVNEYLCCSESGNNINPAYLPSWYKCDATTTLASIALMLCLMLVLLL